MCTTIGLLGGIGTEHEDFHPSLIVTASPDLFLDGKPVAWPGIRWPPRQSPVRAASREEVLVLSFLIPGCQSGSRHRRCGDSCKQRTGRIRSH